MRAIRGYQATFGSSSVYWLLLGVAHWASGTFKAECGRNQSLQSGLDYKTCLQGRRTPTMGGALFGTIDPGLGALLGSCPVVYDNHCVSGWPNILSTLLHSSSPGGRSVASDIASSRCTSQRTRLFVRYSAGIWGLFKLFNYAELEGPPLGSDPYQQLSKLHPGILQEL